MGTEIQVLGSLQVLRDGAVLNLMNAHKPRLLLAILVSRSGQPLSASMLIDALWVTDPPRSAHKNLLQYVHRLRHCIGRSAIVTGPVGYSIASGENTDAATFLRLLRVGTILFEKRRYSEAARELWRSLELWRGDAFSEFGDSQLIRAVAGPLDRARTAAAERLAEIKISLGQAGDVPPFLMSHVQRDPLNENLRVHMMRALAFSGRRAEALQLYRDTRTMLVEELGIEPGNALRETHDSILRGNNRLVATSRS